MTPFFSVVIPLFNKENEIKNTLQSVLEQTFQDFEIIIVNDGSTDNSLINARSVLDNCISIYSTENLGVSHARNYGIEKSHANYIAFLDADDLWYRNHLAELKNLILDFPGCGMYCKAYEKISGNTILKTKFKDIPNMGAWRGVIEDYFHHSLINELSSSSSVAIPKSVFDDIGFFGTNLNSGEDTDFWIRTAFKYNTAFDNKVSVIHNLNAQEKITKTRLGQRNHLNPNTYKLEEKNNKSLKKFLDHLRYVNAVKYKLEKEMEFSVEQYKSIDKKNLSRLQQIIYHLPQSIIQTALSSRAFLRQCNIDLRLFR